MAFDKPYQLNGDPDASMVYKTDEMLEMLFQKVGELEAQQQGTGENAASNVDVTRWLTGPWTLDSLYPTDNTATIRQDPVASTTYHDYAPEGIDTAVALELEPTGSGVSFTGIRQFQRQRRFLGIINRDSAESLTLVHENTGSTARYRFKLPSSTDIVLGPNEAAWMYYNIGAERWQLFITPHSSGGLNGGNGALVTTFNLSEAQLEAMTGASGVEVVSAPGAGYRYVIVHYHVQTDVTDAYTNAPNYVAILTGKTVAGISSGGPAFNGVNVSHVTGIPSADTYTEATSDPENVGITIRLNAALTGVGAATAKGAVLYYKVAIA